MTLTLNKTTETSLSVKTIRILLVDDHTMVHIGIAGMLEAFDDLELVGEAINGVEALAMCQAVEPHVILMDLAMPDMDGITAIREILRQSPEICIIALTNFEDSDRVSRALEAGANGYLLKNVTAQELAAAIRSTYCGRVTLAPEAAQALLNANAKPAFTPFTERERETMTYLVQGLSNAEIAEQLCVSPFTVKNHVRNILQKLNAANRAEAAILALKYDLVPIE